MNNPFIGAIVYYIPTEEDIKPFQLLAGDDVSKLDAVIVSVDENKIATLQVMFPRRHHPKLLYNIQLTTDEEMKPGCWIGNHAMKRVEVLKRKEFITVQ